MDNLYFPRQNSTIKRPWISHRIRPSQSRWYGGDYPQRTYLSFWNISLNFPQCTCYQYFYESIWSTLQWSLSVTQSQFPRVSPLRWIVHGTLWERGFRKPYNAPATSTSMSQSDLPSSDPTVSPNPSFPESAHSDESSTGPYESGGSENPIQL